MDFVNSLMSQLWHGKDQCEKSHYYWRRLCDALTGPGASIVRFGQVDEGVYKGSRPKNDADFKFLQSKFIKTILQLKFLPFLDRAEKRKANHYGIIFKTALMNASLCAPSEI